jgi:AsmA protein
MAVVFCQGRLLVRRTVKIAGIALGVLVGVVAVILLAVKFFVDPNEYKDRIAHAVRSSTGRDLSLPGRITLSVFPSISLELGPASLGNLPGFGEEPFASVKHAALQVRLLPLLRKQLEIGRVEIDGLDLRLRKNSAGVGNWQTPGHSGSAPGTSAASGAPAALRDIAGVSITDSRISYQDMSAAHINLDVGRFASGADVPVRVKLDLTPGAGAQPVGIDGHFVFTAGAQQRYRLAKLDVEGTVHPTAGGRALPWKLSASRADVDLEAQTLRVADLGAQLGAAHIALRLAGSSIVDAASLAGSFRLDPVSPRELMSQLAVAAPETRDPKALGKISAMGELAYGENKVQLSKLDVQLDDSRLGGKIAVTNLATKAIAFDLALDRIDLDRYRPPVQNHPQPVATSSAQGSKSSTDVLKTLQMDGTFALQAATFAALHVSDLHLTVHAKDGVTHLAPVTAGLYGGQYAGEVTLDDRGEILQSRLEQTLSGVDVASLLKDFTKSQRFAGRGTITTSLTARGSGGDEVLKSLNGRATANLDHGAVEGVDLWFEINRAMSLVQKQAMPAGSSSGRTKFDSFKVSADIANGLASTKDLNIASQNLHVTGQGSTNLVTQAVSYQLNAALSQQGAAPLASIPLTINGTVSAPQVRVDLVALARTQLQNQLNGHKDDLKKQLQNKLQDLLK